MARLDHLIYRQSTLNPFSQVTNANDGMAVAAMGSDHINAGILEKPELPYIISKELAL